MKEVQINGVEYLLVEVPSEAVNCKVFKSEKYWQISYDYINDESMSGGIALFYKDFGGKKKYPLELSLIAKAYNLTEEGWQGIVERFNNGAFRDYSDKKLWSPDDDNIDFLLTATESGYSLLELHGFKPETTLILKRKA